jgi:CheY-like chemotaxis protein
MIQNIFQKTIRFLNEDYERSRHNIFFGSLIFLIGHPFYWALSVYVLNEKYDSVFFRFSSSFSSLFLIFLLYKTERSYHKYKPHFMILWYFWVMWILPITFTYIMLMNDLSKLSLISETIMIFLVILFISNFIIIALVLLLGIFLAILFYSINNPINFFTQANEIQHILSILPLAIICGTLFLEKAKQGDFDKRKAKLFRSLAGSIAHEIRNPLNCINATIPQIENLINHLNRFNINENDKKTLHLNLNNKDLIEKIIENSNLINNEKKLFSEFIESIAKSAKEANEIIDLVLNDLREKPIDESEFIYVNPSEIISLIQKYYPPINFKNRILFENFNQESLKNFNIKIIKQRFYFIFNNLIKNSLYYVDQFPNMHIKIGFEQKIINDQDFNIIYFLDNGPGIQSVKIGKLFKDFTTFSKSGGTGLGLAFCNKNMKILGGDIICESEYGNGEQGWTKFSLLFPAPSQFEINKSQNNKTIKKILLVDDHKINLIALKTKIEKIIPQISCDIANSGFEALNRVSNHRYNLILMDIQMPGVDGIETCKKIKRINADIPIICSTSLSFETFSKELSKKNCNNLFIDYVSKLAPSNILIRSISKNIIDYKDTFHYLINYKINILSSLNNKKIILADDQDLNRMMTKRILEKYGLIVIEASNGKEIIKHYIDSLDINKKSSFDAIITDINMNIINGEEASKEIRRIEKTNKTNYENRIPIIALSGDISIEIASNYFNAGIDDYFIKGNNFDNLINIIANFFVKINNENCQIIINKDDNHKKIDYKNLTVFNPDFINNFSLNERNKIINLFIEDCKQIISEILKYKNQPDFENINSQIHSLKGILANIGAEKFTHYIKNLDINLLFETEFFYKIIEEIKNLNDELINELGKLMTQGNIN